MLIHAKRSRFSKETKEAKRREMFEFKNQGRPVHVNGNNWGFTVDFC